MSELSKLKSFKDKVFIHIIVLGYGNFVSTTQRCLESLIREVEQQDVTITVIDNGSLDNSAELQRRFLESFPQVNAVYLPRNLGFAAGMNYGAGLIETTWVILMGSDTVLTEGSFNIFYQSLENLSLSVGIVGPITNEAGNSQRLHLSGNSPNLVLLSYENAMLSRCGLVTTIERADFFCVAIRKIIWEELNGLDLSYGKGYYEDYDFCVRAKSLGTKIVMLEDVLVYHAGSASFRWDVQQKKIIKANKNIFIKKFPNVKLLHRRADNLQILESYLTLDKDIFYTPAVQSRLKMRLWMAENETPRSFWKKWLWQHKVKQVKKAIYKRTNTVNDNIL
jgi:GT2 family glycosyltransferase